MATKTGWGSIKTGKGSLHGRRKNYLSGVFRTPAQKRADAKRRKKR